MSEENKSIIESAFTFSDISEVSENTRKENGNFIKTWRINNNKNKDDVQEEEEDEAQFEEEETEGRDSLIAISEEYETYGTEKSQNIRLKKRTFYRKPDGSPNVAYYEVFQYKKDDISTPEETGISKLTDAQGKTIGYRYYRNGINNNFKNNDFVTVTKDPDGQYRLIQGTGDYEEDLEIINSIFREHYKGKISNDITGNPQKRVGVLALIREKSEKLENSPFIFISKDIAIDPELGYVDKKDIEKYKEQAKNCGKTVVIPVVASNHRSTLFLEPNGNMSLFDTSTAHLTKDKQPNPGIFGEYSDKIESLNKENIQYSGCCCFFSDTLCEIIVDRENGFLSVNNIKKGIDDGSLQLKMSAKMCNIFDEDPTLPTLKISEKIDDINGEKYFIKEINRVHYGVSKDIFNPHGNKFLLLKGLVNCFEENGKTSEKFKEFEEIANVQYECYLFENHVVKPIKEKILTLEKYKSCNDVYSVFNDEGIDYYYYQKLKTNSNKKEQEFYNNIRQEYLKNLNDIFGKISETLAEKERIIEEKPVDPGKIKNLLGAKRNEIVKQAKISPAYQHVLRINSVGICNTHKIQMNKMYNSQTTKQKSSSQPPFSQPISFVQRESLKRQQKQKSISTPVRFGY